MSKTKARAVADIVFLALNRIFKEQRFVCLLVDRLIELREKAAPEESR